MHEICLFHPLLFSALFPDLWLSHLCSVYALHPDFGMQFKATALLAGQVCGSAGGEGRLDCAAASPEIDSECLSRSV